MARRLGEMERKNSRRLTVAGSGVMESGGPLAEPARSATMSGLQLVFWTDMLMPTSADIRQQFIDFFVERHDHAFVPSSPVVLPNDPTLLFTNAGMNQFKPYFLGTEKPEHPRAVNSQKCIRAGGKHNDLEDVGRDTYHHTFFEMLGNWSFGDYFKAQAIDWAWELLAGVWAMDPQRLHVTYFQGDASEGLDPDTEARDLWKNHLPDDHIHPGGKKDNFWEMGDTGPCGPCSEIHYDATPDKNGGERVNRDDPQVIEFWNLVFIQFNRAPGKNGQPGKLDPLPAKHVDTGLGFERICRILQGRHSNYETDVFTPIFDAIREVTGVRAYTGQLDDPVDTAYRVIADHIRCLVIAVADGVMPSNEGRGYVLRRILRRAVRYGRQTLDVAEPFFYRLVPAVVAQLGEAFPEVTKNPGAVAEVLQEEEDQFRHTLDRGIERFEAACGSASGKQIDGDTAFELYATSGFPLDLTQLMAAERGMTVDVNGFNEAFREHQETSRAGAEGGDARASLVDIVQKSELADTQFAGYDRMVVEDARAAAVHVVNGDRYEPVDDLPVGTDAAVVVDRTPFYAEAGGQVGDSGYIRSHEGAVFRVEDTIKVGNVHFHLGRLESGNMRRSRPSLASGTPIMLEVDADRRRRIMTHHTATHVMNHKLRMVLGDHVQQKGSLVDDRKTRFDFSHNQALGADEVASIEEQVNADVTADLPVHAAVAPQDEALKIHGLRAVFGEKYPPHVRVVSIGPPPENLLAAPAQDKWYGYSIEFCGGTHVENTGEIGSFTIVSEEAVAKGVRRLTAVAGEGAAEAIANGQTLLERLETVSDAESGKLTRAVTEIGEAMNEQPLPLTVRVKLRDGIAELHKVIKAHEKQQSKQAAGEVVETARRIADQAEGDVIVTSVEGADASTLRTAMDVIRKSRPAAAMLLAAVAEGKVVLLAAVPEAKIKRGLKAGDWVRQTAKIVGGGGGGRPDMAQAGGKDPSKLADALADARTYAADQLE